MQKWNIQCISKNHYKISKDSTYIEFILDGFDDNSAILISNTNLPHMSEDNVIFINEPYPTPDTDENPVIGIAYKYDSIRRECLKQTLVIAHIIDTNLSKNSAKHELETITY